MTIDVSTKPEDFEGYLEANIEAELLPIADEIREELMMACPWKTGNLAGSILVTVMGGGIDVEMAYYGLFVDKGTIYISPRNFVDPILDKYIDRVYDAYNRVAMKYINKENKGVPVINNVGKEYKLSDEAKMVMNETMLLLEAERAVRMSLLVVEQMGLPKNINDLVIKLQQSVMVVISFTRAVRLLTIAAEMSNPYTAILGMANLGITLAMSAKLVAGGI